jgi:hypothetical protein
MPESKIDKEMSRFGKKLAIYLKANLEEALIKGKKRGGANAQEADLNFEEVVTLTNDGVRLQIIAMAGGKPVDYWANIEQGRKPGTMPPPNVLGKKWMAKNNINAREVYLEIQAKYTKKRLSKTNRKLSKTKKTLSYDEYANRLSYIFARAIKRDGIPPKPYVQQAIREANVEEFQQRISELMGEQINVELSLDNAFTPIKLNF